MLLELSAGFIEWLVHATTCGRGAHDVFDLHIRSTMVIRRDATTHVTLGDDAYQFEVFSILDHRRATVS